MDENGVPPGWPSCRPLGRQLSGPQVAVIWPPTRFFCRKSIYPWEKVAGQVAGQLATNFHPELYRFVATEGVSDLQRNLQRKLSGPQVSFSWPSTFGTAVGRSVGRQLGNDRVARPPGFGGTPVLEIVSRFGIRGYRARQVPPRGWRNLRLAEPTHVRSWPPTRLLRRKSIRP